MKTIPCHVAIVMDGNGRWAQAKNILRKKGHSAGVKTIDSVVEAALSAGVKYLTLYALSIENLNFRPKREIDFLFSLLEDAFYKKKDFFLKQGIRVKIIGNRSQLPSSVLSIIKDIEHHTSEEDKLTLIIAVNYSGRWDICQAVDQCIQQGVDVPITEDVFSKYLSLAGVPDVDLLIRTGKEYRISNFMLWNLAYTELYFSPVFWPAFTREDFIDALDFFSHRERRFGRVKEDSIGGVSC